MLPDAGVVVPRARRRGAEPGGRGAAARGARARSSRGGPACLLGGAGEAVAEAPGLGAGVDDVGAVGEAGGRGPGPAGGGGEPGPPPAWERGGGGPPTPVAG